MPLASGVSWLKLRIGAYSFYEGTLSSMGLSRPARRSIGCPNLIMKASHLPGASRRKPRETPRSSP
eukprot:11170782-Lingulodinium_polyedra.AAC.1